MFPVVNVYEDRAWGQREIGWPNLIRVKAGVWQVGHGALNDNDYTLFTLTEDS